MWLLALAACTDDGEDSRGSADSLVWYTTCGDPVCAGYNKKAHDVDPCTTELAGETCASESVPCDLQDKCNTELVCTENDPKDQTGGCPISLAEAKQAISKLNPSERQAIAQELLAMELKQYSYREGSNGKHLGFVIDERRSDSFAVANDGRRVDLYGYISMAVVTLQEQQQQIDALRREVASLRAP